MRINFSKIVNDKEFKCFREVEGKSKLTQIITVEGLGFKSDDVEYGEGGHLINTMQSAAKIIAGEIIREPVVN